VLAGAALSARARLDLQALLGPFLSAPAGPRGVEPRVTVRWARPPWSPPLGELSPLERKRAAYWLNQPRNDFLATVVAALSAGDREALWGCGLLLADKDANLLGDGPAVTVLVESTEHGGELLRRLPGWDLVSEVPGAASAPNPWKLRPLDRTVLTYRAAVRRKRLDTDVLVVAGAEWPAEVNGFPPRGPGAGREVVVIDLADDFDNNAKEATRRRLRDYAFRGWVSAGGPRWAAQDGEGAEPGRRGRQHSGPRS
jgi:hypothetical protein